VCCSQLLVTILEVDADRSEYLLLVEPRATDGMGIAWLVSRTQEADRSENILSVKPWSAGGVGVVWLALVLDAVRSEYLVAVLPRTTDGGGEQSVLRSKGISLLSEMFGRARQASTSFARKTPSRQRLLILRAWLSGLGGVLS